MENKITVIKDTREKDGWNFENSSYVGLLINQSLPTGDYTVKGLEDILCIERKGAVSEMALNSSEKRFTNELKRMTEFKYRYLICEFSIQNILDWPYKSGIPKSRIPHIKVTPQFLMRTLSVIQVEYGIQTLFCSNKIGAEYTAINIMRRVHERETKRTGIGGSSLA